MRPVAQRTGHYGEHNIVHGDTLVGVNLTEVGQRGSNGGETAPITRVKLQRR